MDIKKMDIKKLNRLKNSIETVIGIIIGFLFGARFITFLFPFLAHYSSSGIAASTSVYAPLIAIVTGVLLFFGIRTLAYLISAMFLGAGIGIALFELTGFEFLPKLIEISHAMIILLI
ncbi:MAG: hypothetical protein M1462_08680 [Candidatus Thermoplasmatota archaeon]|nr:hypothetical protein [Candidatus Thermoplasmatota archaeon]